MKHISLPIKSLRIKEGESFTLKVEAFGDDREVFVLLENGRLTFCDEQYQNHPTMNEWVELTEDGWKWGTG